MPEKVVTLVSPSCSWIRSLIRRVSTSDTNCITGSQLHWPSDEAAKSNNNHLVIRQKVDNEAVQTLSNCGDS